MLNNLGLGFIFTAKDMASEAVNRLGRSFESFEKKASQTLTRTQLALRQFAVGAAIATAGVLGIAGSLNIADASGVFTQEMSKVAALSDIAADSADGLMLRTTALGAAMATKFAPDEAAKGLQEFAAQGFVAKEQAAALVPALRLAQAGQIGVAESAESMTAALRVFSLDASEAALVTDKLLKIANVTSLQAKDLALSLGTVARGATLTGQSLDEMLISVGLVKNTGVDASVAASSVSSALIFMSKNAKEFEKLGVKVTNVDGSFRNFIDVVTETEAALGQKFPNAADKATAAVELFERFGVTAFQAVSNQIKHGVKNAQGDLLKGAAAVDFLRQSMTNAEGTAAKFEETIMGTFAGQKQLLSGSLKTLAVVAGAPFEAAFKPIVAAIHGFMIGLVEFIQSIPQPVLDFFAKFAIGASVLLTVLGSLIALKGGLMLLSSAMGFLGISVSSVVAPILIVGGALAALGLVVAAFNSDARQSTGSVVDFFKDSFAKIKLFVQGLTQYFRDGELSGPLLDELNKAENQGVKNFLGKVLDFGARLERFFAGVGAGFDRFIKKAEPVFVEFQVALQDLGNSLGFVTGDFEKAADGSMNKFRDSGMALGQTLGELAILMIRALTLGIKMVDAFMEVLDSLGLTVGDVIKIWVLYKATVIGINVVTKAYTLGTWAAAAASRALAAAQGGATGKISAMSGAMAGANTKLTAMLGSTAGKLGLAGLIVTAGLVGYELGTLIDDFFGFSDAIAHGLGNLTGLNNELERLNELNGGVTNKRGQASQIGSGEMLAQIAAQQGLSVEQYQAKRIAELQAQGYDAYVANDGSVQISSGKNDVVSKEQFAVQAREEAASRAGATPVPIQHLDPIGTDMAAADRALREQQDLRNYVESLSNRPLAVTVKLDGEVMQTSVEKHERAGKARAFNPMPVE